MENTNLLNKESWNAYQEDYFKFHLKARPNYFELFANGGVDWEGEDQLVSMAGDVKGLKLLDTCCACDAIQAFSWHNMGAIVTACDIAPKAIEIASNNARVMNLDVEFVVADMQKLSPIIDNQYDIVFATYPYWIQDLQEACRNWHRVLKTGGRLLLNMSHPITDCITENDAGLFIIRDYNKPGQDRSEIFDGTGLSDMFGGWSVDLPSIGTIYRISDVLNAICDADFKIIKTHEANSIDPVDEVPGQKVFTQMKKLPNSFTVLAIK